MSRTHPVRPLDRDLALMAEDHAVPLCRDHVFVSSAFLDDEVDEVGGCPRSDWTFDAEYLSCDDLNFHIVVRVNGDVVAFELLVLWRAELALGVEVQPELKAHCRCVETRRHLCVNDALASRHPLNVTGA